ncbi:MAG: HlyD family efflux transporter periplasmic adaptor subunit, partial [Oscillospiraceae bacterium]
MKKNYIIGFLKWTAIGFVLLFICFQIYMATYNPLTVDTAIFYDAYDGIDVDGYIIRDEVLVKSDQVGVMSYQIPTGGRVAKNGVIAKVYSDENAANAEKNIEEIEKKITSLSEVQTYNDLKAADLDLINSRISTNFMSMLSKTQNGNYFDFKSECDSLLTVMNKKQIVTGQVSDFSPLLNQLESEKKALNASINQPGGTIKSELSGYFISEVDGYENKILSKNLGELTYEQLKAITPDQTHQPGVIGKIVSGYEWYIAATVPLEYSFGLTKGSDMMLKTGLESTPNMSVTVKYINRGTESENSVVVFSCKDMNSELAMLRKLPITIVKKEYSGLRVNSKAVRIVDGVKGVYVISSAQAKFIPINSLYSTENFVICELQNNQTNALRLY